MLIVPEMESCLIQDEPGEGGGFSYKMSLEERSRMLGPATQRLAPCWSSPRVGLRTTSRPDARSRRTAEVGDVRVPWIGFNVVLRWQSRRGAVVACSPSVRPRFAVLRKVLAISVQLMSRAELNSQPESRRIPTFRVCCPDYRHGGPHCVHAFL